jgi:serine/threonine protein kinase
MAPEMVIMLSQASYEKTGYTCAVDWWSLGVTMFKLLTGALRVHILFMLLLSSFVATPVYDC